MENQQSKHPILSIVFPVHDEERNLEELVRRCHTALKDQKEFELIFVDDASTDRSLEILEKLSQRHPSIVLIHHSAKRGQTGAFKSGFDKAKGEVVITMDADLEVLPEDIPLFLDKIKEGYEMVNAIRVDRKHEKLTILQSKLYNFLMRIVFFSPFQDNASNYTAFLSRYIKNLPLVNNDHRYLYPILRSRGLKKCAEVNVTHQLRRGGISKYSRFKAIKNALEIVPAYVRIKLGYYRLKA